MREIEIGTKSSSSMSSRMLSRYSSLKYLRTLYAGFSGAASGCGDGLRISSMRRSAMSMWASRCWGVAFFSRKSETRMLRPGSRASFVFHSL